MPQAAEISVAETDVEKPAPPDSRPGWNWFLLLAVVWLAVNLLTADRSPSVWQDEVSYSDPGINLATGRGWTSTAWPFQSRDEFFCSNVPLHPLALAGWVRIFGWSPTAVRSLNYAFVLLAAAVLWQSLYRSGIVRSIGARLGTTALLFGTVGMAFCFRSGRPDMIAFVLIAIIFSIAVADRDRLSPLRMLVASVLIPLAALQALPYVAFLGIVGFLANRRYFFRVALVGAGCVLGLGGWFAFLQSKGLWPRFWGAVTGASHSGGGITTRIAEAIAGVTEDASAHVLAAALIVFLILRLRHMGLAGLKLREPAVVGLVLGLGVPAFVGFAGKFPIYYAWMKLAPMAVCVMAAWERECATPRSRQWLSHATVAFALLAAAAWPLRMAVTVWEWRQRDYAPVQAFCTAQVTPADYVVCDYQAYYPVKRQAAMTFVYNYIPAMSKADKAAATVLIIDPKDAAEVIAGIGGTWTLTAEYRNDTRSGQAVQGVAKLYKLSVYRRA
ncbi:hypothetical protein [Humisphaera borealis]|uniref:Uncharacterized protein n=1 Tax=Humisphaera borealis TaxID=2807512 RepID=A0A7M2WYD0_9BACT|nr:hypothetical protein [Humisphaera borealis]QOV90475.1 hypothetical protein IPV69_03665 [Humisphaera borealis]